MTDGQTDGQKEAIAISLMLFFKSVGINIFFPIISNKGFGCSKEPYHQDGSFEYPQHMFWLRN